VQAKVPGSGDLRHHLRGVTGEKAMTCKAATGLPHSGDLTDGARALTRSLDHDQRTQHGSRVVHWVDGVVHAARFPSEP
jgi:hypothetical protein